jgi:CheY-like chemotaxis protein/REP element-mobilizing transposase RayT
MAILVLVATPHQAFGELLRLSLEGEGGYQVHLAYSARDAVGQARTQPFDLAILDSDLTDKPLGWLDHQLLRATPAMQVAVIPPENNPRHPRLAGLVYHGYLLRPFYLPDLVELAGKLSGQALPPSPVPDAAQFERAVMASGAEAGILMPKDQPALTCGELSEAMVREFATLAERVQNSPGHTDLVRFARLPDQTADQLFYVTALGSGIALGLTYPLRTPLSQVRLQAGVILKTLAPTRPNSLTAGLITSRARLSDVLEVETAGKEGEEDDRGLAALLDQATHPVDVSPAGEWVAEADLAESSSLFPWDEPPTRPNQPASALEETQPMPVSVPLDETHPVALRLQAEPPPDSLADTRPRRVATPERLGQLGPAAPVYCQLRYQCALIPRLPQQLLTGDLGQQVGQWVRQACLAFDWRLVAIAVRPQSLQWTVELSPGIAPAAMLRTLRRRTSEQIFAAYPSLARQNPSGDFWAGGYLMVAGAETLHPRLLNEYIAATRGRQGLEPAAALAGASER